MGNLLAKLHTSEENKENGIMAEQAGVNLQNAHQTADITSIGSQVRHLSVFEQTTDCYGMAATGGRLYLSISEHHVVDVVDATTGSRVTRWGTFKQPGLAVVGQPAQFNQPWGVAVDEPRARVYVIDKLHHCVVVVRLCDGIVEAVWGSEGSDPHQFRYPRSVAYCRATDRLYVADWGNSCCKVLRGLDGHCVQVLGSERYNHLYYPLGVAVDLNHVYIASTRSHRVVVYAKQSGKFLFQMGQAEGSGDTQFHSPFSVSVDSEAGVLYVADTWNHRVCVYRSRDGRYIRHFQVLRADNTPAKPECVMWDAQTGALYVTIAGSNTTLCVYPR
eukprot:TRINITY_DN1659_c0_g1_i2.p1 TRINITY_DN1659_c0_g1~~TRINITY_DN1659_c0_g1_i2.p1  ORF type:complete len:331 (+),score=15.19 TRINITY_DN1659_c0_g1_i2:76-1068(+)